MLCMFVHIIEEPKVGIKTIKMYCQKMQEQNITRAIIVVQMGMTPSAKQVNLLLKHTLIQTFMIQCFVMFFFFFYGVCLMGKYWSKFLLTVPSWYGTQIHLGTISTTRAAHQHHRAWGIHRWSIHSFCISIYCKMYFLPLALTFSFDALHFCLSACAWAQCHDKRGSNGTSCKIVSLHICTFDIWFALRKWSFVCIQVLMGIDLTSELSPVFFFSNSLTLI